MSKDKIKVIQTELEKRGGIMDEKQPLPEEGRGLCWGGFFLTVI